MTTFIAIGSVMVLAALALVLWPLTRYAAAKGERWTHVAIVVVAIPALAVALYVALSSWEWNAPPPQTADAAQAAPEGVPPFVMQMISGLEAKLKADPGNLDGWLMLGRSYFQLQQYDKSVDAYQRAYTLSRGENVDAIVGLGEGMIHADPQTMSGPAAELFEQAFEQAPRNPKVLWYSGLIAIQSQKPDRARERWSALVALDPPPEVKKILVEKLADLEKQLAMPPAAR